MARIKFSTIAVPHTLSVMTSGAYGAILAEGARGYLSVWLVIAGTIGFILLMAVVGAIYEDRLNK